MEVIYTDWFQWKYLTSLDNMYYTNTIFKNLLIVIEFKTTLENILKNSDMDYFSQDFTCSEMSRWYACVFASLYLNGQN